MSRCAADQVRPRATLDDFQGLEVALQAAEPREHRAASSFGWPIRAMRQMWQGDAHLPALARLRRPLGVKLLLVVGGEHVVAESGGPAPRWNGRAP